jgi:hypothetical protein
MSEFAEDFRKEIADAYDVLLNDRKDALAAARLGGVGGLAHWIRDELFLELNNALECANPGDIDYACSRIGLAALMMRDAGRAMEKMFSDAYEGPESEREAKLRTGIQAHSPKMTGIQWVAHYRFQQIDQKGFTAETDAAHTDLDLQKAAEAYLREVEFGPRGDRTPRDPWPWDAKFWKPSTPIRMLAKAGALIAAEIDRRLHAGEAVQKPVETIEAVSA